MFNTASKIKWVHNTKESSGILFYFFVFRLSSEQCFLLLIYEKMTKTVYLEKISAEDSGTLCC